MSRVGNRTLIIPEGVSITNENNLVKISGKLGTLERQFSPLISIEVNGNEITTKRSNEEKHTKQLHGTTNAHIANMLIGVSKGFEKGLEIKGVGYKATINGDKLTLSAGYSHDVVLTIPSDVNVSVAGQKQTEILVKGIDKQSVGSFAAIVRGVRRPNVYSGKGISYKGEKIRLKEGKTASK